MKINEPISTLRERITRAGGHDIGEPNPEFLITPGGKNKIVAIEGVIKEAARSYFKLSMPVVISSVSNPKINYVQPLCIHGAN